MEIIEGVLCHGLALYRDPIVEVQINFHHMSMVAVRILGEGRLRAEREDDGQGNEQHCARPDQKNNRKFGSHLHCLYLSPIDELSCKKA